MVKNKSERLSRSWVLYLFANGALKYAHQGDRRQLDLGGLPIGSVGTEERATSFQVMFCKLSRQDNETYFLPWPAPRGGTLEDEALENEERQKALSAATELVEEWHQLKVDGVSGKALWEPFMKYRKAINDPTLGLLNLAREEEPSAEEVDEILREGRENPLPLDEAKALLRKVGEKLGIDQVETDRIAEEREKGDENTERQGSPGYDHAAGYHD